MSAGDEAGNLTLSIKGLADATLAKGHLAVGGADKVTLTSARVIIEKIELENESDNSIDFKFNQPFVQDLLSIGTLQEIQTFQVPPGTYDKVKVSIDDLDVEDGDVFVQNPQLQNLSIRIEGYLNEDPAQVFVFTSDISLGITVDFSPPIVIDETTVNKNIIIDLEYASWLVDDSGRFLDPTVAGNKERIERNITNSLKVFKDDDRDGERDDDDDERDDDHENEQVFEAVAGIDSLEADYLVVAGTRLFLDENTDILAERQDNYVRIAFSDLQVGMRVVVRAVFGEDGRWLATKVKVKNETEARTVVEIRAAIDSVAVNYIVIGDTRIFVDDATVFRGEDDHDSNDFTFADLQPGMLVELRAVLREDGSLVATKIELAGR
jgi:hypothetical protein